MPSATSLPQCKHDSSTQTEWLRDSTPFHPFAWPCSCIVGSLNASSGTIVEPRNDGVAMSGAELHGRIERVGICLFLVVDLFLFPPWSLALLAHSHMPLDLVEGTARLLPGPDTRSAVLRRTPHTRAEFRFRKMTFVGRKREQRTAKPRTLPRTAPRRSHLIPHTVVLETRHLVIPQRVSIDCALQSGPAHSYQRLPRLFLPRTLRCRRRAFSNLSQIRQVCQVRRRLIPLQLPQRT